MIVVDRIIGTKSFLEAMSFLALVRVVFETISWLLCLIGVSMDWTFVGPMIITSLLLLCSSLLVFRNCDSNA